MIFPNIKKSPSFNEKVLIRYSGLLEFPCPLEITK